MKGRTPTIKLIHKHFILIIRLIFIKLNVKYGRIESNKVVG